MPRKKRYNLTRGKVTLEYASICGFCDYQGSIVIDPKMRGKKLLDTILHEVLHMECPDLSEEDVTRIASRQADVAHGEGFRKQPPKKSQLKK